MLDTDRTSEAPATRNALGSTALLQHCFKVYQALVQYSSLPVLDERQIVLAAFRSLALEHLRSILLLASEGMDRSALALFRPLMETIVRGEWLCFCAESTYCEAFMHGKYDRGHISFRAMARAVDQAVDMGSRHETIENFFVSMSDFTNTGYAAIVPHLGVKDSTTASLPSSQLEQCVQQATKLTALHVRVALQAAQHYESAAKSQPKHMVERCRDLASYRIE